MMVKGSVMRQSSTAFGSVTPALRTRTWTWCWPTELSFVTQVYVEVVLQSCTRTGLLPSSRAYWYWSGGVPLIAVVVQVIVTPAGAGKVVLAANVTIWAI